MKQKLVIILLIIVAFFLGIIATILILNNKNNIQTTSKNVSITESNTISAAVKKVYDGVVILETYKGNQLYGSGTGFAYKTDNNKTYIMTNNHVVASETTIKIINTASKTYEAKVLGTDEYSDIAVLSVDKGAVTTTIDIGDSSKSEIGDTLFTVGTPVNSVYMGSVTKGILSGKNRSIPISLSSGSYMMEVLQTDAAINPGNSGGPLLNIDGQVIGVTNSKLVQDEIEGIGFAIPIETAMAQVEKLEKGEKIQRPVMGVQLLDLTTAKLYYSNYFGIDKNLTEGAVIAKIESGSVAEKAGFKAGDVVIKIDNTKIDSTAKFRYILYQHTKNDTITVIYNRSGKELSAKVKLTDIIES